MDDTHLYLVRVWRGEQRFRATVRRVNDETPQYFDTPEAVAAYLRNTAAPSAELPMAARQDIDFHCAAPPATR